jgi:hypothetical protein
VVHSDNEYGNHGFETLSSLAGKYNVCFTAPQRVDRENFSDRDYDQVLHNIANKTEVRGESVRRNNMDKMSWKGNLQLQLL